MKYLALVYGNAEVWGSLEPVAMQQLIARVDAFNRELTASGEMLVVEGLADPARAVRLAGGVPVVSDGPYLEAKEHVGSMFLLDVESDERALEIARSYPGTAFAEGAGGGLELWPLRTKGGPQE